VSDVQGDNSYSAGVKVAETMLISQHRAALMVLVAVALAAFLVAAPSLAATPATETFNGRELIVYVPDHLPPPGRRALVIVLHGGLGNARRIVAAQNESGLNLDAEADAHGFIVAYLDGTPVTLRMGPEFLGWNAGGGCCGQSFARNVDDVGYIKGAVAELARRYGVDPARVFGYGHSKRLICETDLLAAGVAVSGPLNLPVATCPAAKGKRVLAIHGADDENVPIAGGKGTKGISGATYASEAHSREVMTASGAVYELDIVPGADHKLDDIDAALQRIEGQSVQRKAVAFFGLDRGP
jgi:polyhydroxybutyrate depolymerase